MKSWKTVLLAIIAILFLSFFLRVYNLTIIPVFADEAIYIRWAQVMRSVPELRFLPLSDGKQPLFMWSVIPFFKLFSDPLFAGRFLSVLCGVGTTVGVGILSFLLFQNNKSQITNDKKEKRENIFRDLKFGSWDLALPVFAMFFYAISPFAVFFDRLALADAMLSLFGIWMFIFAILAARYQRLDSAMIAGFMLGGAFLTKSPAVYFALLLPITILFCDLTQKKDRVLNVFKVVGLWGVTWGIGYGFYNILRLGANFHMLSSRNLDYVYPITHIIERPLDPLKPFLMEVVRWLWIMGPGVFVVLVIAGILLHIKRYPRQIVFLTLLAFGPILVSAEFAKVFTARYIFFSFPYLIILAASVVFVLSRRVNLQQSHKFYLFYVRCAQALFVVFILHALIIDYLYLTKPQSAPIPRSERSGYLEEWTAGYGIKEIDNYLRGELKREPDRKIVVGTEGYFGTLPDGLQMYLNDRPEITVIGVGQPIRNVHESLTESKKAGNKTYLVVNSTRFLGDYEKLGMKLIHSYPKAERPDGTRESLLLFEI
jgi:4-amino-4-deoxy-L-arabinose transferase-like glycosyltransferase